MNDAPSNKSALQPREAFLPRKGSLERLSSFRFTYAAIFLFLLLYVYSIRGVEAYLTGYYRELLAPALNVDAYVGPISLQIERNLNQTLRESKFVRWGGCQVNPIVFAADGQTLLYVGGRGVTPLLTSSRDAFDPAWQEVHLLPLSFDVTVTVPHNSVIANLILLAYAAILLQAIFLFNRALLRREHRALESALVELEGAAERAQDIEQELAAVWHELEETEELLENRGATSGSAAVPEAASRLRFEALEAERHTLEELLDEALADLSHKNETIEALEQNLKKRTKGPRRQGRELVLVARRLRTLYKNLEFDDRAIEDLVALGDEAMKLKAEESIKRLSDEADNVKIRRKLGGFPEGLPIFELGFAGKGRIYFTKGKQRAHRVLAVGAKNTQKADLDYLSHVEL